MAFSKKEWWGILAFVGLLLVIFAFTDLGISQQLYRPESTFGLLFQMISEIPAGIFAAFAGSILWLFSTRTYPNEKEITREKALLLSFFGFLTWAAGSFMVSYIPLRYMANPTLGIRLIIGLGTGIVSLLLVRKMPVHTRPNGKKVALVGAMLFFTTLIGFTVVKMLWGRMRFREMLPPYEGFSKWFIPQKLTMDDSYMSFPSGHTAQGSSMLMLTLLPVIFTKLEKKKWILKTIAFVWIALVALSRIILGAHFASDVTMGFALAFALFTFWSKIFLGKKMEKEERKE